MPPPPPVRLLALLLLLPCACFSEGELASEVRCGPRDLTPECCLKQLPNEWERCTGSPRMVKVAETATAPARAPSLGAKAVAAGVAATVALNPTIHSAERRGAELASNLLEKVEQAIVRCAREADKTVNKQHFNGGSPSRELCNQVKVGERTTWAAYLGLYKHEESWPCLSKALDKLVPRRYLLHPRFRFNEKTGKWEYMTEEEVRRAIVEHGWSGLKGTIEPDIILMDALGFIVHVYDLKFPCPETNDAHWPRYKDGPWRDQTQGDAYEKVLQARPRLVSPREGVIKPILENQGELPP
jgi:hypothetical protein